MNDRVHVSFQIMVISGYMPRSSIDGSYGSGILPVLKLKVLCLGNSLSPKEIGIANHLLGVLLERVAFGRAFTERKDIESQLVGDKVGEEVVEVVSGDNRILNILYLRCP